MAETVFIYCLKDPNMDDVRYIGQTNNLKRRLKRHLSASSKSKTHLGNWLRSLKGEKPVLAVLHEVAENESWAEEERRYISCARAMGVDLVNATDGGEGTTGWVASLETRAAMSAAKKGVPKPPKTRAAMSAAQKGLPKSPEARAAMSALKKGVPQQSPAQCAARAAKKGVPHSPEHCAAIGAALKGVSRSPDACAAMSVARKGVPWSPAQRAAYEAGKLEKLAVK